MVLMENHSDKMQYINEGRIMNVSNKELFEKVMSIL